VRIWQKILLILSFPILFEIVFVVTLAALVIRADQVSDQYERTKDVLLRFSRAEMALFRAIIHLEKTTSEKEDFEDFDTMLRAIDDWEVTAKNEADVRPELREAMAEAPDIFEHLRQVILKAKKVYTDPAIQRQSKADYIRRDFFALMLEIKPLLTEMHRADAEVHNLAPKELDLLRVEIALFTVFGLGISAAVSIFGARILFKDIVGRLDAIQQNAHRVAMGAELLPVAKTRDEIGDLDMAFRDAAAIIADARRKEFAILEKSVDVLFSLDKGMRFTAVGESVAKAWLYEPGELRARAFSGILSEGLAARAKSAFELAVNADKEQQFDGRIKCGDHTFRDVHFTVAWQLTNKSFHCVAHDITERRKLERNKQELLAIAGTALDAPLTAVAQTLAGLASRYSGSISDTLDSMMQRAIGNLQRLTRLIGDLLDIEQMESGKIVLNCNRQEASSICTTAIDAVSPLANRMGVRLVQGAGTAELLADRRRIEQILVNLLSNAIKFSPKGEEVSVSITQLPDAVELSVADHGPGIDESERDLIFERFYQTKTKSDAPIKSTGLGLTICKVLVEAHHGQIGVDSAVGQGSRFWIRLPAFDPNSSEDSN